MKIATIPKLKYTLAGVLALTVMPTRADTFGSGVNQFNIDFVNIGNAGNANDAGAGGGLYSSPYGGVSYNYRMGVTEVAQDWITKATNLGLANVTAGAWTGNQPAANITWFHAAAFVNFLNTSTGHKAAYQLDAGATTLTLWSSAQAWQAGGENLYRHKDAFYFLPSETEWYKSAFHQNDGVTANYWDYATASNSAPTAVVSGTGAGTAVFNNVTTFPATVDNNGGLSAYGTRGQGGNVWEWQESAFDGVNDSPSENRAYRDGSWVSPEISMRSTERLSITSGEYLDVGFRVASVVPEPTSVALLGLGAVLFVTRRRRSTVSMASVLTRTL
jgi:hypothetical protein